MCKHILLVDDEKTLLKLMKTSLEHVGYSVTTFEHPSNALNYFKENYLNIDLVITDLRMNEMQGDEFSNEILQIKSNIPIFLFTGFNTIELKEKAKFLKIKEVLDKSFSFKTILSKIKDYLK